MNKKTQYIESTFGNSLGNSVNYPQQYNADLLYAIPRDTYRDTVQGFDTEQQVHGLDRWNCYELSWLNTQGKPEVCCAQIDITQDSPFIVESKSLKLYLNSLNQHRFDSVEAMRQTIEQDLCHKLQTQVLITVSYIDSYKVLDNRESNALLLDTLNITCSDYQRAPQLLRVGERTVEQETVYSHLLRSNCPVTNQPDWATVSLCYSGLQIDHSALLAYIVSYRQHSGFHEQCVEQIFFDIIHYCKPLELSVVAQYTRRGGIDINPVRSTQTQLPAFGRVNRQ